MNRQSFGLQDKADAGQTARKAKTAAKRGTPINGFQMNEEIREWAREKGITVRLDLEFEKFRDYHQARGTVFKDWNAALRNWLRKAQEFQAPQTPLRTVNGRRYETDRGICPGSAQDQIRQITRQFLREQGEERDEGGESIEGICRAVK